MTTPIISLTLNLTAIVLYTIATAYIASQLSRQRTANSSWLLVLSCAALLTHAGGTYHILFGTQGLQLGIFKVGSLIFWVINLIVLVSGLRKPLQSLYLLLFPLTALTVALAQFSQNNSNGLTELSLAISIHILLSILAYSLLIIVTLQALLLAYQNHQLRSRHLTGTIRLLPPLQTMELLLFEVLWVGYACLCLSLITGFIFIEDIFAQHLVHKTLLSILAWAIYSTLLWGHLRLGWRGNTAVRWTLGGFTALMAAYFGSKFVLEVILNIGKV